MSALAEASQQSAGSPALERMPASSPASPTHQPPYGPVGSDPTPSCSSAARAAMAQVRAASPKQPPCLDPILACSSAAPAATVPAWSASSTRQPPCGRVGPGPSPAGSLAARAAMAQAWAAPSCVRAA
eukprot:399105-Prymnesium_polylepis.1